jgi:hypothetical protein
MSHCARSISACQGTDQGTHHGTRIGTDRNTGTPRRQGGAVIGGRRRESLMGQGTIAECRFSGSDRSVPAAAAAPKGDG